MKEFRMLLREDISKMSLLSEEDFQSEIQEYTAWVEEMSQKGNYISGNPLEPEGRYILKNWV